MIPAYNRQTCTIQFWCKDVCLWCLQQVLSHTAPLITLLSADGATLYIDSQKNGSQGGIIHHSAMPGALCPVKALAWHMHAITSFKGALNAPLSLFTPVHHITASHIVHTIQLVAGQAGLLAHGYTLTCIGVHSLHALGAMALKLNGFDELTIMKLGHWTSNIFMSYLHPSCPNCSSHHWHGNLHDGDLLFPHGFFLFSHPSGPGPFPLGGLS